jgi:hypothetical protein
MPIKGTYDWRDIYNAQKLIFRPKRSVRILLCVLILTVALSVVVLTALSLLDVETSLLFLPIGLMIPLWVVLHYGAMPVATYFLYRRNKYLQQVHSIECTESLLRISSEAVTFKVPWQWCKCFKENARLFLVRSELSAHIVPKHFLGSEEEIAKFREVLRNHMRDAT